MLLKSSYRYDYTAARPKAGSTFLLQGKYACLDCPVNPKNGPAGDLWVSTACDPILGQDHTDSSIGTRAGSSGDGLPPSTGGAAT